MNAGLQAWEAQRMTRKTFGPISEEVAANASAAGLDPELAKTWLTGWAASERGGGHPELVSPLPQSISAWDAARVVHLGRLLVDAGFTTEVRAFEEIAKAVVFSRGDYTSWQEFGHAFVVGRAFWKAQNVRNPIDTELETFDSHVRLIMRDSTSPWNTIAW